MTNLNDIVSTLSSEDQQYFIMFLERKNTRSDTKNVQLFKLLIKDELNSKEVCLKLYKAYKKDAYHALRKRLYQSLIDFIADSSLEEDKVVDITKNVLTQLYKALWVKRSVWKNMLSNKGN